VSGPPPPPRTIGRRNVHLSLVVPAILVVGLVVVAQTATPEHSSSNLVAPPATLPTRQDPEVPTAVQVQAAHDALEALEAWRLAHGDEDAAGLHRRAVGAAAAAGAVPELRERARAIEREALARIEAERDRTLRVGESLEQAGLFHAAQQVYRGYLARTGEGAPAATHPAFEALKRTGRAQAQVARDRAWLEARLREKDVARADAIAGWIGVYAGADAERVVRSSYPILQQPR
jgi:hypothetical protein